MQSLVDQGTPPDMIQLGNEINPGMLWDYAATWTGVRRPTTEPASR